MLNEPGSEPAPDLLPALARLIVAAAATAQIIVVSHAPSLMEAVSAVPWCVHLALEKVFGETKLMSRALFNAPEMGMACALSGR